MNRVWSGLRRNVVVAGTVALLGVVGYLVYEAYQEDQTSETSGVAEEELERPSDILIVETTARNTTVEASNETSEHKAKKRMLAVSARGIILDPRTTKSADKWTADVKVRESGAAALARLAAVYDVYVVVVVRNGGDEVPVLRELERGGIVDVVIPACNVLFCQTEEGKTHLVRHLLTLPATSSTANAGYVDTNRDAVNRLAAVLRKVVLVTDGEIACGEVPGANTAFSSSSSSTAGIMSSTGTEEQVADIAESTLFPL
ncbi:hypothetical protein GGI04_003494 [Coemansia thaxteri]|nr:hypothetical protein GGI04_003494 [Coemansia thaxteri]KAJ2465789.1 hypothetical protein GGI02_004588 [Coemansia sp. RSA 2322]KAJ2475731.1 hypothetical protein EV174_005172 [Coemansia sp. RSA 2320]